MAIAPYSGPEPIKPWMFGRDCCREVELIGIGESSGLFIRGDLGFCIAAVWHCGRDDLSLPACRRCVLQRSGLLLLGQNEHGEHDDDGGSDCQRGAVGNV